MDHNSLLSIFLVINHLQNSFVLGDNLQFSLLHYIYSSHKKFPKKSHHLNIHLLSQLSPTFFNFILTNLKSDKSNYMNSKDKTKISQVH